MKRRRITRSNLKAMFERENSGPHGPIPNAARPEWPDSWAGREAIAEKTATVDYGCEFDTRGLCKRTREKSHDYLEKPPYSPIDRTTGCCGSCWNDVGWLRRVNPANLTAIVKLWSARWGFWRPGKGCTLPRAWRSIPCLTYSCNYYAAAQLIQIGAAPDYSTPSWREKLTIKRLSKWPKL